VIGERARDLLRRLKDRPSFPKLEFDELSELESFGRRHHSTKTVLVGQFCPQQAIGCACLYFSSPRRILWKLKSYVSERSIGAIWHKTCSGKSLERSF
jgi:hypothetical protein